MPDMAPQKQKELKVKIATRLHVRLHARKILHGTPIQETITAALDLYFREHPAPVLGADARIEA